MEAVTLNQTKLSPVHILINQTRMQASVMRSPVSLSDTDKILAQAEEMLQLYSFDLFDDFYERGTLYS